VDIRPGDGVKMQRKHNLDVMAKGVTSILR